MKGTEKQVEWAEDIKAKITANNFGMETITKVGQKAIDYISSIDDAKFWIDNRDKLGVHLLQDIAKGRLRIKGNGYSHTAQITPDGTITVTWTEIVHDGKGGHKETRSKVVA